MKDFNLNIETKINSGFNVPENYFDNFSDKIIGALPKKEVKVIPIFAKRKTWIKVVAALLILQLTIPVINHFYNQSIESENATFENYISSNTFVNENDIAELLTENDFKKLNNNLKIEDEIIENELLGNVNIEEYLIN
ncbi:MAG: hypothetical protein H7174_11500 [Flavobacterium sp.]|nr:hypothetical protein [Flavobacterium sp.]